MLQPTAASHRRAMILEVMGRDGGHIALNAGIAGWADVILIPEIPYSLKSIAKHIEKSVHGMKNYCIVLLKNFQEPNVFNENICVPRNNIISFRIRPKIYKIINLIF